MESQIYLILCLEMSDVVWVGNKESWFKPFPSLPES